MKGPGYPSQYGDYATTWVIRSSNSGTAKTLFSPEISDGFWLSIQRTIQ
jgi:hypothetical protein